MLSYVATSLFESPAQTLVNTVNTVGVMGKGIAAEFKRRYPEMFQRYKAFCDRKELQIGQLYVYRTPNKWVLNFPTKKHWRNPSKLDYIKAGLEKFALTYAEQGVSSVSFPQLGCGNGGLQWRDVQPVMEKYLAKLSIPVYVHIARRSDQFVPEHLSTEARREAMRERQEIGFTQFFSELQRLVGGPSVAERIFPMSPEEAMPTLVWTLHGGNTVQIPGEDLEDLWNSLRLRGAIRSAEFPGSLRERAEVVLPLLLQLDYIRPIQFLSEAGGRKEVPGIRFAPASTPRSTSDVALPEPVH
jgi:O-acetyl-ADP-ribose deacetylase (regulator of RNase III)